MKTLLRPFTSKRLLQAGAILIIGVAATLASAKTFPPKCGAASSGWAFFTTAPGEPPAGNLCQMGAPTPNPAALNASGDYQWACVIAATPTDPVQRKTCFGPNQKEDGKCGVAHNKSFLGVPQATPPGNLCATNSPATAVLSSMTASGVTQYQWTCPGLKGGAPISCQAQGPKVVKGGNDSAPPPPSKE